MKDKGAPAAGLPDQVFVIHPTDDRLVILLKKGEPGYYRIGSEMTPSDALKMVDILNDRLGITPTKAQVEAMIAGSMFGWGCPGADPKSYQT